MLFWLMRVSIAKPVNYHKLSRYVHGFWSRQGDGARNACYWTLLSLGVDAHFQGETVHHGATMCNTCTCFMFFSKTARSLEFSGRDQCAGDLCKALRRARKWVLSGLRFWCCLVHLGSFSCTASGAKAFFFLGSRFQLIVFVILFCVCMCVICVCVYLYLYRIL